jgi:hypothetical protein
MTDKPDGKHPQPTIKEINERERAAMAKLAEAQERLNKACATLSECLAKLDRAENVLRAARSERDEHTKRRRKR